MQHPGHNNGKSINRQAPETLEGSQPPGQIIISTEWGIAACTAELRRLFEAEGNRVTETDEASKGPSDMESEPPDSVTGVLCVGFASLSRALLSDMSDVRSPLLEWTGAAGLPLVVSPGGLDHICLGAQEDLLVQYRNRMRHTISDSETLIRTDVVDNARLGRLLADLINAATGPVAVCLPLRGLSSLDAPGGPFYLGEANMALFGNLTTHLRRDIKLYDCNVNINDPMFARLCYEAFSVLTIPESRRRP